MDDASIDVKRAARDAAYAMPLEEINPGDNELFRTDTHWPYFERLGARVVGQWQAHAPASADCDDVYRLVRYASFEHWEATRADRMLQGVAS